jgi:5-methylcytosine-specific restriction endonuclease McrA
VTIGKSEFSNSQNANIQKWSAYVRGSANRQDFWACALDWVSKGNTDEYMSRNRALDNISEVKTYFNTVLDWVASVFVNVEKEMCGLEWGRLYEAHHKKPYDPSSMELKVKNLYGDPYVKNRRGIYEYLLAGEKDAQLLDVRVFDAAVSRSTYKSQTDLAKSSGKSNCPICAIGSDSNRAHIWAFDEMEADHVAAWSKGGATSADNCQMLCKTHNRGKGNR